MSGINRSHGRYRLIVLKDEMRAIELAPYDFGDGGTDCDGERFSRHVVAFAVYGICLKPDGGYEFLNLDDPRVAENIEQAVWRLRGSVKWDGCVDYEHNMGTGDDYCLLHDCGLSGREDELNVWRAIYRAAAEIMDETADRSLMGLLDS